MRFNPSNKNRSDRYRLNWRRYQRQLNRVDAHRRVYKRLPKYAAAAVVLAVLFFAVTAGIGALGSRQERSEEERAATDASPNTGFENRIDKKELQALVSGKALLNLRDASFNIATGGGPLQIDTSLDMSLQLYLMKKLNPSFSRYIGVVVLDPSTGRVLAMVGTDKSGGAANPCTDILFPAASVFKIVTASAAVAELGISSDSVFNYNGRKHTLYKSQLTPKKNRYTNQTTLKKSFAQSINPVFGKLGSNYLGRGLLKKYADAFGFNRAIDFEIDLPESCARFTDDAYQWAELASGFNRETRISALHGALLSAVIVNGGRLLEPTIIDQVTDAGGDVLYRSRPETIQRAISPDACRQVAELMNATVVAGTSRRAFRGVRRDGVLSRLYIGGKTGSIDNRGHDARYDWFVGFARERDGDEQIVISAVVAHEKYIGTRAAEYARLAIRKYFESIFASREKEAEKASG